MPVTREGLLHRKTPVHQFRNFFVITTGRKGVRTTERNNISRRFIQRPCIKYRSREYSMYPSKGKGTQDEDAGTSNEKDFFLIYPLVVPLYSPEHISRG